MPGVLDAFARHVHASRANLVLAGPAVTGVSDDPEGEAVWDETVAAWKGLSASNRARIHLACIPMNDPIENAIVVNALQRHAAVVVQKSLAEGFGLTVAEAMWKTRPVVATAVGGIVDQVDPRRDRPPCRRPARPRGPRRRRRLAPPQSGGGAAPGTQRATPHRATVPGRPPPASVRRAAHRNRQHFGEQEDDHCAPDTKRRIGIGRHAQRETLCGSTIS